MTLMTYALVGLVLLLLIVLVYALNERAIKRKTQALSEEIERYIEAEVEIRLEEARITDSEKGQ